MTDPIHHPLDRATLLRIEALRAASVVAAGLIKSDRGIMDDGKLAKTFEPGSLTLDIAEQLETYLRGEGPTT